MKIPYYSQWESPELVDEILVGTLSAEDDPKWKSFGAPSKHDYLQWSWNSCGIACLKSILEYRFHQKYKLYNLVNLCESYGCYVVDKRMFSTKDYKKSIEGLFYKPFIKCIATEFHLRAKLKKILVTREIIKEISNENFVIVSVDPHIRNTKDNKQQDGGHLVLVVGYDLNNKLLFIHNPSGYWKKTQAFAEISFKNFEKFFANKGVVIYNQNI